MRNLSIALGLLVAILIANGAAAADPSGRCDTCRVEPPPTPRPTPVVVGLPLPTAAAPATLPPTDTRP